MMKTRIREANEWITMRRHDEADTATLPRILLVGDSIVEGYGVPVKTKLAGQYGVDTFATSKIVCDEDFMSDLQVMVSRCRYDVIIFNNGLHGSNVEDEHYVSGLREVLTELKNLTPLLVWRNSTPCYARAEDEVNPWVERVRVRNQLAEAVALDLGVPMIDCYSALKDQPELVCDGVHFYAKGYEIITNTICDYLESIVT